MNIEPVEVPMPARAQAWEEWIEQREDFLQSEGLPFPNEVLDWAQAAFYAGWNAHGHPRWEMNRSTRPAGDRFAGPGMEGL